MVPDDAGGRVIYRHAGRHARGFWEFADFLPRSTALRDSGYLDHLSGLEIQVSASVQGLVRIESAMPALSDHLFWDVDRSMIDPEKHAPWLVKRVLEYGRWSDWQALVAHYGKPRLAEIVMKLRSLQPRALAFCHTWFQLPPNTFRCSTSKLSQMPSKIY